MSELRLSRDYVTKIIQLKSRAVPGFQRIESGSRAHVLNLYTSGSLTPERFRITWKARCTQIAKSTLCSSSSENVFLRSSQMTHVLLVQGWARRCSQLSYQPPLSTDEKTGSQTTWITQDHTIVRSWANNLKACWSDICETPESQLPHVYNGGISITSLHTC